MTRDILHACIIISFHAPSFTSKQIYMSKYKKVGVLPIRIIYSVMFRTLALRQRKTAVSVYISSCIPNVRHQFQYIELPFPRKTTSLSFKRIHALLGKNPLFIMWLVFSDRTVYFRRIRFENDPFRFPTAEKNWNCFLWCLHWRLCVPLLSV